MEYAPVGGGSYHWVVHDTQGGQWFVTVDDLDDKSFLGETRPVVGARLRTAMDTAFALRHDAGLRFVVAPVAKVDGETVLPLSSQYTVTVFPFIHGASGRFGEDLPADERGRVVDMLAALHRATPAAAVSRAHPGVPLRGVLEKALSELDEPWRGGPFSEPARAVLASTAGQVRRLLQTFDQLARQVAATSQPVLTHGEPHPANIIRAGQDRVLIDWDTVGLAPPERDLWMVVTDTGDEAPRYQQATGRAVDPAALELYRIRWGLDDISCFVHQFRTNHSRSADAEWAWLNLEGTLARAFG